MRTCSRTGCSARATRTLTYVYADSTAVLGPLALQRTPGGYDLCTLHAEATSVPRGWEVIRLPDADQPVQAADDDLLALADAIREVGMRCDEVPADARHDELPDDVVVLAEKGHLRMLGSHHASTP